MRGSNSITSRFTSLSPRSPSPTPASSSSSPSASSSVSVTSRGGSGGGNATIASGNKQPLETPSTLSNAERMARSLKLLASWTDLNKEDSPILRNSSQELLQEWQKWKYFHEYQYAVDITPVSLSTTVPMTPMTCNVTRPTTPPSVEPSTSNYLLSTKTTPDVINSTQKPTLLSNLAKIPSPNSSPSNTPTSTPVSPREAANSSSAPRKETNTLLPRHAGGSTFESVSLNRRMVTMGSTSVLDGLGITITRRSPNSNAALFSTAPMPSTNSLFATAPSRTSQAIPTSQKPQDAAIPPQWRSTDTLDELTSPPAVPVVPIPKNRGWFGNQSPTQFWDQFCSRLHGDSPVFEKSRNMRNIIYKFGIPSEKRAKVWMNMTSAAVRKEKNTGYYQVLLSRYEGKKSHAIEQIEKDVTRTHIGSNAFQTTEGRQSLLRVLTTYSWFNSHVGYCQAMNFITAMFLLHMEEEDAFWLLITLIENLLPGDYFTDNLAGVMIDMVVLNQFAQQHFSKLLEHLASYGIIIDVFAARWFLTLFIGVFPLETALRIVDSFFYDGDKVLFRVVLGLLRLCEDELLSYCDANSLMTTLQNFPASVKPDVLIEATGEYDISNSKLGTLRAIARSQQAPHSGPFLTRKPNMVASQPTKIPVTPLVAVIAPSTTTVGNVPNNPNMSVLCAAVSPPTVSDQGTKEGDVLPVPVPEPQTPINSTQTSSAELSALCILPFPLSESPPQGPDAPPKTSD
ncbi:TBC1 domain family member 9 [Pelomyxa schiedti]|nr:TBC1 domain family member 9 [Pelomyxa schiedti]